MFPATTTTLAARRSANFYREVIDGLRAEHKHLSSKYFYDEIGDKLFQQIMASPEYYPTRSELEILQYQSGKMVRIFMEEGASFDLVELGPSYVNCNANGRPLPTIRSISRPR
jgi:L-histidine Nalpha-methyltransferase